MKKIFTIILISLIVCFFCECKKGEGDPKFSFRTRKARVEGEWRLVKAHLTFDVTDLKKSEHYDEVYEVEGTRYNCTASTILTISRFSGVYILNVAFDKKGNFSMKEIFGAKILEGKGTWDFNSGVGDEKKKEVIQMCITDVSSDKTGNYSHFFNMNSINFKYKIKALHNKEMVLTTENSVYINSDGQTHTMQAEYTFIQ